MQFTALGVVRVEISSRDEHVRCQRIVFASHLLDGCIHVRASVAKRRKGQLLSDMGASVRMNIIWRRRWSSVCCLFALECSPHAREASERAVPRPINRHRSRRKRKMRLANDRNSLHGEMCCGCPTTPQKFRGAFRHFRKRFEWMKGNRPGRKPVFKLRDSPPKRDVQGGRASYSISEPLFIPPPGFISPPIEDLAYTMIGELPVCTHVGGRVASSLISGQMKAVARKGLNDDLDKAVLRVYEEYCTRHPGSPAAVRRPRILVDRGRFVALFGRTVKRGILGFGSSVTTALRAFDDLYLCDRVCCERH